ncbi:mitochondrial carrier protein-domain-containing protein [Dunaliella salina]|uniref:Mitochondrial carrier protein-domain-containing protein n=1 Tax=Dunaliella salina TaxID=3046 RepID=A0ABQ7H8E3_DUNSA|nr:mitochondrial carrier protein-domain-containing protein [Dunaliella salina]|eukprot:KAF5843122.1 mitochondrial carrier protein-domain-containing protein [Dunaliella salina]
MAAASSNDKVSSVDKASSSAAAAAAAGQGNQHPVWFAEAICGALAGSANVVSGYPFDTVKVRMQSSPPHHFQSSLQCFQHILKTEGVANGLFRGVTSPLLGGMLETGVNYMVYCRVLSYLTQPRSLSMLSAGAQSHTSSGVDVAHHALTPVQSRSGNPAQVAPAQSSSGIPAGTAVVQPSSGAGAPQVPMIAAAGAVAAGLMRSGPDAASAYQVRDKLASYMNRVLDLDPVVGPRLPDVQGVLNGPVGYVDR